MRGHRLFSMLLVLAAGGATVLAQTSSTAPASIVRLSYVQGTVSILQGDTTQFNQAQANMPLLPGYTVATGQDGQAEVEFTDGSVARLTPQSQLRLTQLPADARNDATELEMLSGLAYFELNTADGQHYDVHFNSAVAQPAENAIFRINLDDAPELSVFAGSVHAFAPGAFDRTVNEGASLRFRKDDPASLTEAASLQTDSWDRWNQDRDQQIAQEAQQQTSARENSGAANQPGWDDLDAYGDWYPVEGYGNVWTPSNVPAGWDPYSSGYWASYPGWGYTWISGYPWGWLPYHCGAWNYWDSFGWGWIPGQCGLGWQPGLTIWNAPHGWRPPPRPIPGGHIGTPIIAVNRGPALPLNRGMRATHTQPVRIEGQRVDPLPVIGSPTLGGRFNYRGTGVTTAPVVHSSGFAGNGGTNEHVLPPGSTVRGGAPAGVIPRPVFRPAPPQAMRPAMPAPQPRMAAPAPRMSAPEPHMSAPAPRMSAPASAPAMSAPHASAPSSSGGHR